MKWLTLTSAALAAAVIAPSSAAQSMAFGQNGYTVSDPLFTVGETIGSYTPPGILDGLGAIELDASTVRVYANHELLNFRGYPYTVNGGALTMTGARISYFDIDKATRQVIDAGLAYDTVYDHNGNIPTDLSFLLEGFGGFSRFCSSNLVEAGTYGFEDTIYFTGEEDGGQFNPLGGNFWALDTANGDFWAVPALGRGAWESLAFVDFPVDGLVAMILADDSSPRDVDGDGEAEAAPLYAYVGKKNPNGDFLDRNGLKNGNLFVLSSQTGETSPLEFNGFGFLNFVWKFIDNNPQPYNASEDGSTGFDEYGYPVQNTLWSRAEAAGAFGFSRPEDVSTNPANGLQVVLASTGVDTYAVDPVTGNGVDTFGTQYVLNLNTDGTGQLIIQYDGDADPRRALRSPDNLVWATDGFIYSQEDEAEEDTLSGDEVLFGSGAVNPNEAGGVRTSTGGQSLRVYTIDRDVILDGSIANPADAVDVDAGAAGEWESSGIIDVSALFGEEAGSLFLIDIQAHGIEDQDQFNPSSRINDGDLVEGGQLLFLSKN